MLSNRRVSPLRRLAPARYAPAMAPRPRFDPTNLDLTGFDVSAMLDSEAGRATRTVVGTAAVGVREVTYVTVGFAVLGMRRLRLGRRDLSQRLRR